MVCAMIMKREEKGRQNETKDVERLRMTPRLLEFETVTEIAMGATINKPLGLIVS